MTVMIVMVVIIVMIVMKVMTVMIVIIVITVMTVMMELTVMIVLIVMIVIILVELVILVTVMIETEAGLSNCDAIAAVAGVDMLFIGAHDLSVEMGLASQPDHPRLHAAIDQVLQAAKRHGKAVGLGGMAANAEALKYWIARGVQFVSLGSDLSFLLQGATRSVASVRAMQAMPAP